MARAIQKSKRLDGVDIIIIYVYDSDTFKHQKKITDIFKKHKDSIYFSEESFEDFLSCHITKSAYRNKKPNLSRQLVEEIRDLSLNSIKKCLKKPSKFNDFKSIYDLLLELFEKKL